MAPATSGEREDGEASTSDNMIAHLESILKELEEAQGCKDSEARGALAELKKSTAALSEAEAASRSLQEDDSPDAEPDVLEIASSLDRLDAQLGALSNSLDTLDEPSRQLLQHSAQLWLTPAAVDRAMESNGQTASHIAPAADRGRQARGAHVNGSVSDMATAAAPGGDSRSDLPEAGKG